MEVQLKVSDNGRILLPKAVRDAIGLGQGAQTVTLTVKGGQAVIETPLQKARRLKSLFADDAARLKSEGRSAVEELIESRREAARAEMAG